MASSNYYYIKTRSYHEMSWWRSEGKVPSAVYLEYGPVTKWARFRVGKDFDKRVDDMYNIHLMIKDLNEYQFYNSATKTYYTRNTPTNTFRLRKRSGGYREITVFSEEYKQLHSLLMDIYKELVPVFPDSVGAYIKGKSQLNTVEKHMYAKVHISIDLSNFYPSIKTASLTQVLKSIAIFKANLTDLSIDKLVEMSTYSGITIGDGSLAQGSSISPILSNIFSIPLDYEMYKYTLNTNITYTRYADDISLSSPNIIALPNKRKLKAFVKEMQDKLDLLYNNDLKINDTKTKLQFEGQIKVLGISVNEDPITRQPKLSVGKTRKQDYSRELFKLLSDLTDGQVDDRLIDYQIIRGKIEYLNQFEKRWFDNQVVKLRRTFNFTGDVWRHILSLVSPETQEQ